MFVGHYGVSFAAKPLEQRIPLWLLFLAVQFLDVLWGILVLLGIERVRIVPGITATNPLDLYYMPYTHSLVGALFWSAVAGGAYWLWRRERSGPGAALIVGAAVFSHWVLDLVVHRPDLPLIGDRYKVGLGLWNAPALAFLLEVVLLVGGLTLYLRATQRGTRGGVTGFLVLAAALVATQGIVFFGAPPETPAQAAAAALAAYFLFAGAAGWLERRPAPRGNGGVLQS